jgi:hypothetical protein
MGLTEKQKRDILIEMIKNLKGIVKQALKLLADIS